jgi:hypothetical protein
MASRSFVVLVSPNRFVESMAQAEAPLVVMNESLSCWSTSAVPVKTAASNPSEKRTTYLRP